MNRHTFLLIFLTLFKQNLSLDHCPVFIIDGGILQDSISFPVNPFKSITSEDFSKITDHVQKNRGTVLFFIEEYFSVEDISAKDEIGTSFPYLRETLLDKKTVYFPKVIDPYARIRQMFEIFDYNSFYLRSTTSTLRLDDSYKFLYIFFIDGNNETRIDTLRRHDNMMKSVMFAAHQFRKGPVTAFYTGKRNPVQINEDISLRTKVSLANDERAWSSLDCGNATFEFYDAKLVNAKEIRLEPTGCRYVRGNDYFGYDIFFYPYTNNDKMKTYRLRFMFIHLEPPAKGWKWTEIAWTTDKYGTLYSHAVNIINAWDQWYASTAPLLITPSEWYEPKCVITSFKIILRTKQRSKTEKTNAFTTTAFGNKGTTFPAVWPYRNGNYPMFLRTSPNENEAEGDTATPIARESPDEEETPNVKGKEVFFTMPILSGVVVVAIMLGILQWGVYMLFNCASNDRLDSPDGKPLMTATEGD